MNEHNYDEFDDENEGFDHNPELAPMMMSPERLQDNISHFNYLREFLDAESANAILDEVYDTARSISSLLKNPQRQTRRLDLPMHV